MSIPTMSKKDLATVAGYTYRRLFDIDQDLPKDKKLFVPAEEGKYDLPMFVQRWVKFNVERNEEEVDDLTVVKARHEAVKIQKTELEVERMRGQLVDVNDVKRLWGDIANTVMQNMLRVPNKLAPILCDEDSAEQIAVLIDRELRDVLSALSETPLPDYAGNIESEESEESEDDED